MNKTTTRNGNGHKTRNAVKKSLDTSVQSLAVALLKAADDVYAAQTRADDARREYEGHVLALSVRAVAEPLFEGKEPDTRRCAANDKEREIAIGLTCHLDDQYAELREAHEQAARDLALCKARQTNYRIAAKLVLKD